MNAAAIQNFFGAMLQSATAASPGDVLLNATLYLDLEQAFAKKR